jgi:ribosomal protein S18 acetylase RimI-like enzyme
MSAAAKTYPWASEFGGRAVTFRKMRVEDKELFKNFVRSLPTKDNFYLLVDARSDQALDRWIKSVEAGHILSVIALENDQMIGYCNLHVNDLPWARHVGEIRIGVGAAHRGSGLGKALANEGFAMARARGLEKIWARMASSQEAAQRVLHSLGFHTEALLSGFVKNEHGLSESLVIMSYDAGEHWEM